MDVNVETIKAKVLRGQTFKQWFVEFLQFCTVGLGSYVVDVGIFNLLAYTDIIHLPGDQPMTAKVISVAISVIFSWVVNRLWTFRNKSDKQPLRELVLFVLINVGGLLISLACLGVSRYVLGFTSQFADNIAANIVGLILGTAFRYICYRYVVFTKDDAAVSDSRPSVADSRPSVSDAVPNDAGRPVRSDVAVAPAPAVERANR